MVLFLSIFHSLNTNDVVVCFLRQIQELCKMPAAKDISLISGYLTFQAQDNHQIISFSSLDNNIEEPNKVFSIRLVCSKGLTDIPSMDDTSIVTGASNFCFPFTI